MSNTAGDVTLVIPARNVSRTIRPCLEAATAILHRDSLREIILVDDGSTDDTPDVSHAYPVRYMRLEGRGPGAARNAGWRAASTDLVWFVDADCVAEEDALSLLLSHLDAPDVGGVGGSYGNMLPGSILARLIHEEIVDRHRRMPREVDFLATFNVVYRREVLDSLGGFDEAFLLAQDAEFAYRVCKAGYRLRMETRSQVMHYHPHRLTRYLRTQARQGFWRVQLYREHPRAGSGDAYSTWVDHAQPPLAAVSVGLLALIPVGFPPVIPLIGVLSVAALQIPMTARILRRRPSPSYLLFAPMAFLRAFARAAGLLTGLATLIRPAETAGSPR